MPCFDVGKIFRSRQPDAITTIETTVGVMETDVMTVVTIATAIAVIVDTIGIATAIGVMTVIVTVPVRPESLQRLIVIAVPTFKNARGSSEIRAPRSTLFSRLTPHGFRERALTNQL
jgi:hypothetical protein